MPTVQGNVAYRLLSDGSGYSAFVANDLIYSNGLITEIEILDEFNGLPVKEIEESGFEDCGYLTSIEIPASVELIGAYAFKDCSSLTNITFNAKEGYAWVLSMYWEEYDLYVPAGGRVDECEITELVEWSTNGYCFSQWSEALSFELSSDGTYYICTGGGMNSHIKIPAEHNNKPVKEIAGGAFSEADITFRPSLKSVEIPSSITKIGDNAFSMCSSLSSVTFAENSQLTTIGGGAFYDCGSLTSIEIPASVTNIGDRAFSYSGLINITLNTKEGYAWAIYDSSNLVKYEDEVDDMAELLTYLKGESYRFEQVENLNWEFVLSSDGTYYILTGTKLQTIRKANIPAEYNNKPVKEIRESAFKNCDSLTNLEIPASVETIGEMAFGVCENLNQVTFGANSQLKTIGDNAFWNCDITSIEIPASVVTIGDDAFNGCGNLSQVTFEANSQLKTIEQTAFCGCAITSIEIPASVKTIGAAAFGLCDNLSQVTFEENSQLTTIGGMAFYLCSSLENIEIPAGVEIIGDGAFGGCAITSIEIPASVVIIRRMAFACDNLSQVTLNNKEGYAWAIYDDSTDAFVKYADDVADMTELLTYLKGDYYFKQFDNELNMVVFTIDYADIKTYTATYNVPGETAEIQGQGMDLDIYNFKIENITENSIVYIYASGGEMQIIGPNNIGLGEAMEYINDNEYPPDSVVGDDGQPLVYSFNLTAGESFKFCVAQFKYSSRAAEVQIYCPPQSGSQNNVAYRLLSDGSGYSAFAANNLVSNIEILEEFNGLPVKEIEESGFEDCGYLTSIEIPASVELIGDGAFGGCDNLSQVTLNAKEGKAWVLYDSSNAFWGSASSLLQPVLIFLLKENYSFKQNAIEQNGICYLPNSNNESYIVIGGLNSELTTANILSEINGKPVNEIANSAFDGMDIYDFSSLTSVEIPASVETIGDDAFNGCGNLSQVTFEANSKLKIIGRWAFSGCAIPSIQIPASVETIEFQAFYGCHNLSQVTLNNKEGYAWAIYDDTSTFVKYADDVDDMAELLTYLKEDYSFAQIVDERE